MTNPKKLGSSQRRRRRRKTAKKILQQNNILQVLPSHIITDITLRLPINSIIHCMRVCKTWLNLILQPDFADLHLSTSPRATDDDTFLCYIEEDSKIFTLAPIESPTIARENLLVFATPKQLPVLNSRDGQSANGLICVHAGRTFYIYNPITKEHVVLPRASYCCTKDSVEFAFGFCPKTSQYKVLRAVTTYSSNVKMSGKCEIYTLGTPAWREVSNALIDYEFCDCLSLGSCVNGAIHLLVDREDEINVMLCFDLEIEEFVPFPKPPFDINGLKNLGVLDNCLIATWSKGMSSGILEVWVMQDYTRKDSWSKKWEIDYSEEMDWDSFYGFENLEPRKLLSDGRLVVSYIDQVCFYDPKEKRLTKSELPDKGWFLHTPTFVSPKKVMGQKLSNDNENTKHPTSKRMRLC